MLFQKQKGVWCEFANIFCNTRVHGNLVPANITEWTPNGMYYMYTVNINDLNLVVHW